jgi:tetratricopeptide (TPR) repeat protein
MFSGICFFFVDEMNEWMQYYDSWCEKLKNAAGISFPLVFKWHTEQIRKNWACEAEEFSENVTFVVNTLNQHHHYDLLIEFSQIIFKLVEKTDRVKLQLHLLINAGIACDKLSKKEEANLYYDNAAAIVEKNLADFDDELSRITGSLFFNRAKLLMDTDRNAASALLSRAVDFFKKANFKGGVARSLTMEALLMPEEKTHEKIKLFLEAAQWFEQENDINNQAMSYANVGLRLIQNNQSKMGFQYLQKALHLNLAHHNLFYLGYNYLMMAEAMVLTDDFLMAKHYLEFAETNLRGANIYTYQHRIDELRNIIKNSLVNHLN